MTELHVMKTAIYILPLTIAALLLFIGCYQKKKSPAVGPLTSAPLAVSRPIEKIVRTEAEWKQRLTPEQFKVARQHGTEQAFTGQLWDNHAPGIRWVLSGSRAPPNATRGV